MGIFGPDVDKVVKKLTDEISDLRCWSFESLDERDREKAQDLANTLIRLIPSFKDGDAEYVIKKLQKDLTTDCKWKREVASTIIVKLRNR